MPYTCPLFNISIYLLIKKIWTNFSCKFEVITLSLFLSFCSSYRDPKSQTFLLLFHQGEVRSVALAAIVERDLHNFGLTRLEVGFRRFPTLSNGMQTYHPS